MLWTSRVRKAVCRLDGRPITEQLAIWSSVDVWQNAHIKKIHLPVKLTTLRQKLYRKAKLEPKFRFYVLYDRIYRRDVLISAYQIARANKGAPGVDGVGFKDIEGNADGVEGFVDEIHESLRSKTYRPSPVRRVWIPKPDGRKRPLGVPTIRDRVVQTAVLLIVEPIFEADFMDCSYGFRPGRSAHEALSEVRRHIKEGLRSAYDADLKGYFDSISHDKLMKCLRMRIVDRSLLKLIRLWLQAPVVDKGSGGGKKVVRNRKGTPQGAYLRFWRMCTCTGSRKGSIPPMVRVLGPRHMLSAMRTILWSLPDTRATDCRNISRER